MNLPPLTVQKKYHPYTYQPSTHKIYQAAMVQGHTHPLPTAERAPGVCVHRLQDEEATEFNQQLIQRSLTVPSWGYEFLQVLEPKKK